MTGKIWRAFFLGIICGGAVVASAWTWRASAGGAVMPTDARTAKDGSADGDSRNRISDTKEMARQGAEPALGDLDAGIAKLRAWIGTGTPRLDGREVHEIVARWTRRDGSAVADFVNGAARFPDRIEALAASLAEMARKNPDEVVRWIREQVPEEERERLVIGMSFTSLKAEPGAVIEVMKAFPEIDFSPAISNLLKLAANRDAPAAVRLWEGLNEKYQRETGRIVIAAWARADPMAAWAWAESRPELRALPEVQPALLLGVVGMRPDLVRVYLEKNREQFALLKNYEQAQVIGRLLRVSPQDAEAIFPLLDVVTLGAAFANGAANFSEGPEAAIALMKRWLPPEEQQRAVRGSFESWLFSDAKGAEAWAAAVTEPQVKAAVWAAQFDWHTTRNPARALNMLSGQGRIPDEVSEATTQALWNWSFKEPAAAAEWATANMALLSSEHIGTVASYLVKADEAAAATWVATLPEGMPRETGVRSVVANWVRAGDFDLANQMVGSLANEQRRRVVIFDVYRGVRSGPNNLRVTADRWLESVGIDAETRALWGRQGGPQ